MTACRTYRILALLWVLLGPLGPLGAGHDALHCGRVCAGSACEAAASCDADAGVQISADCPVCDLLVLKGIDRETPAPLLPSLAESPAPDPISEAAPEFLPEITKRGRSPPLFS